MSPFIVDEDASPQKNWSVHPSSTAQLPRPLRYLFHALGRKVFETYVEQNLILMGMSLSWGGVHNAVVGSYPARVTPQPARLSGTRFATCPKSRHTTFCSVCEIDKIAILSETPSAS